MNTWGKRLGGMALALFLFIYVVYQAYLALHTSVEVETVMSRTVYETLDVQGFAVRNEKILTQSTSGYLYYTVENGARVAQDGVIADIYPKEADALTNKKITALDEELHMLETLQKQGSVSKTNLESLNAQIEQTQRGLVQDAVRGQMANMDKWRADLMELLNRKQILIGKVTDFEARIAELKEERSALADGYRSSVGTVTSPVAGYFVSAPDGYENRIAYDKAATLMPEQIHEAIDKKPDAIPKNSVGKVVGNYEWYLACLVPAAKLSEISEGEDLNVQMPFASQDAIPVTVQKINRSGDEAMVLLKCSYMSEALSSVRCEQVQIRLRAHTGLYVPDRALQFNDDNEPGVFVRVGTTLHFRRVQIDYHSDNGGYSICAQDVTVKEQPKKETSDTSDTSSEEEDDAPVVEYLRLYDDMVMGGKNLYDGKIVH